MKKQNAGQRVQLHRAVSKLGWGSRKQAWAWIQAGQVQVDGRTVREPLTWVDLGSQTVTRRGEEARREPLVIAFHKPRGYITTRSDERGRDTIYSLLPDDLPWLFPVGRLDADSEGLLILTNDSQLSVRLTEPDQHVGKTYHVTVRGLPTDKTLATLRGGVELPDGVTRPARVRVLSSKPAEATLEIVLTEGRNRQIRRMCAACGHKVRRLVRVAIGRLKLGDLPPGEHRVLGANEREQLTNG